MKKTTLFFVMLIGLMSINAQTLVQSIFIDFGTTAALSATAADVNGNYWNDVTNPYSTGPAVPLVNTLNVSTGYSQKMVVSLQAFPVANGGLANPSATLLGEFAIASATQDYFSNNVTGSMKFTGLNAARGYKFKIFGSRATTETRIAGYTFAGTNTSYGTLQVGGTDIGADGIYDGNNSTIYTSPYIFPDINNEILLTISLVQGNMSNIAAMKIEEYSDVSTDVDEPVSLQKVYPTFFDTEINVCGAKNIVELYNSTGVKVLTQDVTSDVVVDTKGLSKGIYFLVVDKKTTYKLMK